MGKIPQYQRDKFMSSYAGAPQLDTSEANMVAGVAKATDVVVNVEAKKLQERNEVIIDQQANKALLDYSLAYQRQAKDLEKEYADNPENFPTAVTDMGEKLATEYGKTLKDERVAARFGGAANTVIRQSGASALRWAEVKQEENAKVAWTGSLDVAAQEAGIQSSLDGFKNSLGSIATIAKSNTLISPDTQAKYRDAAIAQAQQNYLRSQAVDNSVEFKKQLAAGEYDTVKFQDVDGETHVLTLSRKDRDAYDALAEDAILNARSRRASERLYAADGESKKLLEGYWSGSVGLGEIVAYQERMTLDPESTPEEKANADELAKLARTINRKEGVPDPLKFPEIYGKYEELKKKIKKNKNKPERVLTELLTLNTQTMAAMNEGELTENEGRGLLKGIAGYISQGITKGGASGWWGGDPYEDAYGFINARSNSLTSATVKQKGAVQGRAYQGFIDRLLAAQDANPGAKIGKKQYMEMATEAYNEAVKMAYPNTAAIESPTNATASKDGGVVQISSTPPDQKAARTLQDSRSDGDTRIKNGWIYTWKAKEAKWYPTEKVNG